MSIPVSNTLCLVQATAADLDQIMVLERQGFAAGHQEQRAAYAQRIATFPQGSLMAWQGTDCVGCVFTEIWRYQPQPDAALFTLGHDIRERHDPVLGTELYISSMALSPAVRGLGLGAQMLLGCMAHVSHAFPKLESALLLVNTNWAPARRIYADLGFAEIACLASFFHTGNGQHEDGLVLRRRRAI
ncbi:MAG: GNAT family N-acetyltransferase [Pseudomonadota bacterium]